MHLLPCPHCETLVPVATTHAGDETTCQQCGETIAIPTLGQLRQLPRAEQDPKTGESQEVAHSDGSMAGRAAFTVFGLVAVASLLVAGFCGIRWLLVETTGTTAEHIETVRTEYAKVPAAQLIREFEDMENLTLELTLPYEYKVKQNKRKAWGRNASIAGAVGGSP